MPIPPSVTGFSGLTQQVRLIIESTSGEQLLLPETAEAGTMSLTTQPNAAFTTTTGCQLHFYVFGNTGAGTIVIAGTAPVTGNAVNSQTYHVPAAPLNNFGYTEFTTSEVFATVNASGITLTGLSGSQIMIFGSPAGKYLLPITADAEEKIAKFSPPDKRGILFKNFRVVALTKEVSLDKFDAALYPDSLWALYMLVSSNPTVTTVPSSATSLLASAAIAATMTLTTGPAAPGEFLIFSITTNTASGTIVLSGTDIYGNAASETITFTSAATQTVYSTKRYGALTSPGTNQFTTTGGTGAHIAVTGVYAWIYTATYDGINNLPLSSACLEVYDGVMGVKLPYTFFSDGTFDWQKEKELLFTGKGGAQDYLIVGDNNPSSYPSGTNPFASLSQPTALPIISWPASWYIDAGLAGTPFTTQDGSLLTFKVQIVTGRKPFWSGDGMQRWSNVTWDAPPDFAIDGTMVFQNYQNYVNYFKVNQPLIMAATFQGSLLGSISSTTYFEQIQWTFPVKFDTAKVDMAKNPVELAFKYMSEYNTNLGYAYKVAWTCQIPPTYKS